ncbi:hypothetical protein LEP1GSC036_1135 [Leptospira weilii str. 2006001853]|uniref:Uncharacterized protein n=1 Tax=Leptospira weilii str. 2006001853 TaxID=1001589 RepID=A0A828Z1C6_9LEPT|nr:hypothetical protein [Leptospira weilii]EKR63781.1 hypothetical protein LEP1GSC036_1135 [Leptospira weilii str. 2006001853]EMN44975.1 hypothetical protein LEP1GSC086_0221 [Leptospira weilii str. LNT 1234]QDK24801.1 hypothetical protein FHG67_12705 [Leptospira weilii]QDK26876.1 hypothetical protein FHG68_09540 [Leptospira weilii]
MTIEATIGAELIEKKLLYKMGDADVLDDYLFAIEAGDPFFVYYNGGGNIEKLTFANAALESANNHINIIQGNVRSGRTHDLLPDLIESELPPFLLSRNALRALKTTGKAEFCFEWSRDHLSLTIKRKVKFTIVIDGKKKKVPVFHCKGQFDNDSDCADVDCDFWILDDNTWPIILKHVEGDLCFWELIEVGKDLGLPNIKKI